ncbi:MAG: hypothetical protein M3069_06675 [Chloroflexota bacterium]|nr:hypothetical protein [Chloroflexota bacterium]
MFEATAQDDALDVLDLMIGSLLARVENEGDRARRRSPARSGREIRQSRRTGGTTQVPPISHAS